MNEQRQEVNMYYNKTAMKRILLILFLMVSFFTWGQNAIVGSGFTSGWGGSSCPTGNGNFNFFTNSAGGTLIRTQQANGAGNQFFRLGIDWDGNTSQRTLTIGSDVQVQPNTPYTLNSNCTTSGAMFINVPASNPNYVFKTLNAGTNPTGRFVFFQIMGDIRTITSVAQSPTSILPGQGVTVTATLNGNLNSGQGVYLRYSSNNFETSTVVQMNGSNTTFTAEIPSSVNTATANIVYYVFTSGNSGPAADGSDADLFTINQNNNNGSNYSYTVQNWTTAQAGVWSSPSTWIGGQVPPINQPVTLNHAVSLNAAQTSGSVTIANGSSLNLNGNTLTLSSGATLTNNGTFNTENSLVVFQGGGTVNGTVSFHNVNLSGSVNFGESSTVTGTLRILANGAVNTNAPTYADNAILAYETGGNYNRDLEFSSNSGNGQPYHVHVRTSNLRLGNSNAARTIRGNLTIDNGATLDFQTNNTALTVLGNVVNNGTITLGSSPGGDIRIHGDFTGNNSLSANGRAIFFEGNQNQIVSSALNPLPLNVVRMNKTGGEVILNQNVSITETPDPITFADNNILNLNGFNIEIGRAAVGSTISIPSSSGFKGHPNSQFVIRGNLLNGVNLNFLENQTLHSLTIDRTGFETVNLSSNLTIQNTLNFTNGNLQVGANTLTLNGAFHTGFPNNLRTTDASNLIFNCTNTGSVTLSNFTSLNNLTVNSPSLTYVVPVNLNINGNLSLQNGSLDVSGRSISIQGAISGTSGQIISNATSNLTFTGTTNWTLPNTVFSTGSVLQNLVINRENTISWNDQNLTLHGDLTITSGGLDIGNNTFSRNTSGGVFSLGANGILSLSGNNNFPSSFGTYTLNAASRVRFYGQAQQIPHLGSNYGHVDLLGSDIKTLADGMVVSGDFTLNENAVSAIASNQVLTVGGGVKRLGNSAFTVSNDAHLIQTGTTNANEGSILVQRQAQLKRLDIALWSSPVEGQTLLNFSPQTLTNRFFAYNESANNWVNVNPATQVMTSGVGYGVRAPNNHPTAVTPFMGNFNGVVRSGDISVHVTKGASTPGFNLVGNPYPSALDLTAFHAANSTRIQNKFYFYEHTLSPANSDASNSNYGVLTLGTPNVYVRASGSQVDAGSFASQARAQVGQGFFVRANNSGNINFTNAMRVAGPATFLGLGTLSDNAPQYDLLRLQLTNPAGDRNETVVGFFPSSTAELDAMDTPGFGTPPVYSRLGTSRLAIQGLSYPLPVQTVVSIGYRSSLSGVFKFELTEKVGQIDQGVWVWLHDLQTGNYHNLSQSSYEFNSVSGQFDERFLLLFTQVLSAPDFATSFGLSVFPEGDILHIKSTAPMREVKVYDVQGRMLYQRLVLSEIRHGLEKLAKTNSVLLVEVTTDSGAKVTQKVVY